MFNYVLYFYNKVGFCDQEVGLFNASPTYGLDKDKTLNKCTQLVMPMTYKHIVVVYI